jgi:Lon-like ATP-dependent protease
MEVIQLSGYLAEDKVEIAKRYLIPQCVARSGVKDGQVRMADQAIADLIRAYCRESGVRNLQKNLEKIYRKAAFQIVKTGAQHIDVTPENLNKFVGNELFTRWVW